MSWGAAEFYPVGAHSLTQILYAGGPKPWQGPDGVHGDIVAPDAAVSGMITCGTGSPLADGSGARRRWRAVANSGPALLAEGA